VFVDSSHHTATHHHTHTSPTSTTLNDHHSDNTTRSNDKEGRATTRWGTMMMWGEQRQGGEQRQCGESNDEGGGGCDGRPSPTMVHLLPLTYIRYTNYPFPPPFPAISTRRGDVASRRVKSLPIPPPRHVKCAKTGTFYVSGCLLPPTLPTPTSISHFERQRVCSAPPPPSLSCFE